MKTHPNSRTAVRLPTEVEGDADEVMEQWEALRQSLLDLREVIARFVVPAWEKMVEQIKVFIVWVRREQLYWSLTKWKVPDRPARWLADKWPERWLPELRFD